MTNSLVEIDVVVLDRKGKVFKIMYLLPMKQYCCLINLFFVQKKCKERLKSIKVENPAEFFTFSLTQ